MELAPPPGRESEKQREEVRRWRRSASRTAYAEVEERAPEEEQPGTELLRRGSDEVAGSSSEAPWERIAAASGATYYTAEAGKECSPKGPCLHSGGTEEALVSSMEECCRAYSCARTWAGCG